MKKSIALVLCLSVPSWGMQLVQQKKGTFSAASSCTVTMTATGAGNLLVGGIAFSIAVIADVSGVSDNASPSNVFTRNTAAAATGTAQASELFHKFNSNAGGTTITFSLTTPLSGDCFAYEFSGVTISSPALDTNGALSSGVPSNPENSATVTPTNPLDVLVTVATAGAAISGVTAPWLGQFGTNGNASAYLFSTSLTAQKASFTGDSGTTYCSSASSFFPATLACSPPVCGFLGGSGL